MYVVFLKSDVLSFIKSRALIVTHLNVKPTTKLSMSQNLTDRMQNRTKLKGRRYYYRLLITNKIYLSFIKVNGDLHRFYRVKTVKRSSHKNLESNK